MILLAGIPDERPLALVAEALEAIGGFDAGTNSMLRVSLVMGSGVIS